MHLRFFLLFSLIFLISSVLGGKLVRREIHSDKCPKNAVFKECTNICPDKTCDTIMMVSSCFSLRCGPPACACKEGHVYLSATDKSQGCVTRETCNKMEKIRNQPVPPV